MAVTLQVGEIVYRPDLYPRSLTDPTLVQDYCENLDRLPPIEVNQHYILIDGWHRWTAHRKAELQTIEAIVTETTSDVQLLELAVARNATHGLQLSREDKETYARAIYHVTPERQRGMKKQVLATLLSVSDSTLHRWLSRIDKDTKEAQQKQAFGLWLGCHTQEAIAEAVGVSQPTVNSWVENFINFSQMTESDKASASHATDFTPPLYNIWKQQEKTAGSSHFGNSESRWVDNLLYLYTKPFGIVVDPFAGGGSTLDLCKKRFRRYWVSDRKPIVERAADIRAHDLTTGLPALPRWQDVELVYLDPPYWKQAEGQYSTDPTDLANMTLEDFTETLAQLIADFAKKLSSGATMALLLQPTQWKAPEKQYTDHVADMLRLVKLPLDMRYSCPYESQQATAQMVEWAKAQKRCLVLTRELVVWRVP